MKTFGQKGKIPILFCSSNIYVKIDWIETLYLYLSGRKNRLRVYHLTWLRNKILKDDPESKRRQEEMLKTEEACKAIDKLTGCEHFSVRKSHFIFTIRIWYTILLPSFDEVHCCEKGENLQLHIMKVSEFQSDNF